MLREDRTVRQYQMLLVNEFNEYVDIENKAAVFSRLQQEVRELRQAGIYRVQNPLDVAPLNAIEDEIADIFIMLCFLCSSLGIDLEGSIKNRIIENIQKGKFGARMGYS
jgi:NTP pyrophosphatase (non-canonical NTP hydrolase)